MKTKIITVIFFFITAVTFSQNIATVTSPGSGLPYIEVTATARQEIAPDEIFISFTITEKPVVAAGVSSPEKGTIDKQDEKVKKELKNMGVDLKNLTSASSPKAMPAADLPRKDYVLMVSSPSVAEKVFSLLEKNDIRNGYVSKASYSKMEELKKETNIRAMKAAKEKATYLLAAIGEQVGKAILVQEPAPSGKEYPSSDGQHPPTAAGWASAMPASAFAPPMPPGALGGSAEIKNIKVQAEILVRFEISH